MAALGVSWGRQDLVPWPGIKPRPPALGAQSLSHWTTWELSRWACFNPVPFLWSLVLWSEFSDSSSEWVKAELVLSPGHQTLPSSGVSLISLVLLMFSHLLALLVIFSSCSVTQSCLTLCHPTDCSMPGCPALHCLPEFAQIHVHWVLVSFYKDIILHCWKQSQISVFKSNQIRESIPEAPEPTRKTHP